MSFKYSFLSCCVREWNKLYNTMQDAESIKQFKSMLKKIFFLNQRSLFTIHDPVGAKLLRRYQLQFNQLNEHKFHHNFKDCVSHMCDCVAETETTSYFFLRCQFFTLICLPKFICNATFYSLNFSLFIDLSFFERLYWRYQLLSAALHHKCICLK